MSEYCVNCATLANEIAALRAEVERYDQNDRQKTREINLLVSENRKLLARVVALETALREIAGRYCFAGDGTHQAIAHNALEAK